MNLTKQDLKAFKGLIEETFDNKIKEKGLSTKDDLKSFATKDDLNAIKSDTNNIQEVIKTLATKKDVQKIDKKFDKLFNFLDKDYLRVKRDVREIESHLNIPVSDF
jgi:hypothetical protein